MSDPRRSRALGQRLSLAGAEIFSGVPVASGLLACTGALVLGTFLVSMDELLPGWADPLNLVLTACLYLAPIAGGISAFHLANLERSGVLRMADATVRGRRPAVLLGLGSIMAWQILALVLFASMILLRSDLDGPRSWAMTLLALQAFALVVCLVMVGAALGLSCPRRITAPVVAVGTFVVLYGLALTEGRWRRFSPVYSDIYYQVYLEPAPAWMASSMLGLVGLSVICGAVVVTRNRARAVVALLLGAMLLALPVSLGHQPGSRPVQYRKPPPVPACQEAGGIRLCHWPESAAQVEVGIDALSKVGSVLGRYLDTAPATFYETGLARPDGAAEFQLPRPGDPSLLFTAVMAYFPPPACTDAQAVQAHSELVRWLSQHVDPAPGAQAAIEAVAALPDAEQAAWASERLALAGSCR